jgi:hypothetical protein
MTGAGTAAPPVNDDGNDDDGAGLRFIEAAAGDKATAE